MHLTQTVCYVKLSNKLKIPFINAFMEISEILCWRKTFEVLVRFSVSGCRFYWPILIHEGVHQIRCSIFMYLYFGEIFQFWWLFPYIDQQLLSPSSSSNNICIFIIGRHFGPHLHNLCPPIICISMIVFTVKHQEWYVVLRHISGECNTFVWGVWEEFQEGVRKGGLEVLKNAVHVKNFSNPTTWRGDMGINLHFQDNIVPWILKHLSQKNNPLLSYSFSSLTTWRGDMGQKTTVFILLSLIHYNRLHVDFQIKNKCFKHTYN